MADSTIIPTATPQQTGKQETLSEWAGPYVTSMLGKAEALSEQPYQVYGGPLTAGPSQLQTQAFQGIGGLGVDPNISAAASTAGALSNMQLGYNPYMFSSAFNAPGTYQPSSFSYGNIGLPSLSQYQMGPAQQVSGTSLTAPQMNVAQTSYMPNIQAYQMGPAQQVSSQQVGTPLMSAAQTAYRPDLQTFQMGAPERVSGLPQVTTRDIQAAQAQYSPQLQTYQMGPAERITTESFARPGSAESYMSPYMQSVVERQQQAAQREADIQQQGLGAQFAKSGAFGGSRFGVERARAAEALARQKGDIQAQGLQSAFQQAQQQFNTEQQARLAAQQANQQAGLTVGQQNLAAQLGVQQLGAGQIGLQTALANLNAQQQANVQSEANRLQAQGMNAQQALQTALANQQAGLTVGQQNLAAQQAAQQLGVQTGLQTSLANLTSEQQANVQNLAAQLQTQGLTADQAMRAALANQQAGLTVGQQNLAALLGVQQLGSQQGLQALLANQQAQMQAQQMAEQSRQYGYGQQMTAAQLGAQYGQAAQQAAEQSRQFGAQFGLQNLAQRLAAAQAQGQLGGVLGEQRRQNLAQMLGAGAAQRDIEQQGISADLAEFMAQRDYPYKQLQFQQSMLQGLPIQSIAAQYQQPNSAANLMNIMGGLMSLYNRAGNTGTTTTPG